MLTAFLVPLYLCVVSTAVAQRALKRWAASLDPAESFGVSGLVGLGILGTVTVMLGLVPGSLRYVAWLALALAVPAVLAVTKGGLGAWKLSLPTGPAKLVALGLSVLCLLPLLETLNPGNMMEWDSFAYHLAVPKIWVEAGQVVPVDTIHHSNFPFAIDGLQVYLVGIGLTGQRLVSFFVFLLGLTAMFGHVRRRSGPAQGWWAALAFAACPVVLWESGTAYIDVSHGLYVGLGVLYASELVTKLAKNEDTTGLAVLAGLLFGLGMGTKFTGIQSFGIAGLIAVAVCATRMAQAWRPLATVAGLAIVLAAPWFLKTYAFTGNPVFPFFYEQLGGKGWNQWRADIYRHEQQSFGVGRVEGRLDPSKLGHAVLGLAYQPGRYTNPGQSIGAGFPTQSVGFLAIATFLLVGALGTRRPESRFVLAWALLTMLAWFVLSQQSRYLTALAVPAAALLGIHLTGRSLKHVLPALTVLQALTSAWLMVRLEAVSPSGFGKPPQIPFAALAGQLNTMPEVQKVALYDEVFGYFLDKPYMWANPGHSDKFDADTAEGLIAQFKASGITHVYHSLAFSAPEQRSRLVSALFESPGTYAPTQAEMDDPNLRWQAFLVELSAQKKLRPTILQNRSILYTVEP